MTTKPDTKKLAEDIRRQTNRDTVDYVGKHAASTINALVQLVQDMDVVAEYLHWRKVNPHIKGGENYLKRMEQALDSAAPVIELGEGK